MKNCFKTVGKVLTAMITFAATAALCNKVYNVTHKTYVPGGRFYEE